MKILRSTLLASALLAPGFALAGGVDPAPPPAPAPVPPPVMYDWSGFYIGGLLGYGDGSYGNGGIFPGDGEGDWNGSLYGIALGYNFQNGNMIYGAELTYSSADMDGSEDCANPAFQCIGTLDSIATLRGRVGYVVAPSTMVFGTFGFARADVNFSTDNGAGPVGENRNLNGYVIGAGAEHALSDSLSLRGSVLYYDFGGDDFQTDIVYDDVGGDLIQLEVGLMFRF
jgi:outer membrane immunogenic protein